MNTLRPFILVAGLLAVAAPLASHAQEKPTYPDADAANHVGEEATVTGKVFTVSKSAKGTTFLNFGARFPNHTFGGVVFAGSEAAVGDVKQYEGKDVALTGRIEAAPDGKPQIVIKTPDQIKLADGTTPPAPANPTPATPPAPPAPPMPVASTSSTSTTSPVPPPAPTAPAAAMSAPKPAAKIVLATNWNSAGAGGQMTRKDLAKVFGAYGSTSSSSGAAVAPPEEVYPGVPYLAPLALAKKRLNLENSTPAKTRIGSAGLPQGSLSAHEFSGVFVGGFNRLFLITDNADQVVSVLAVEENTRARTPNQTDTTGYHTYNFITHRAKGQDDLAVRHEIAVEGAPPGVVVVDSMLVDPNDPEDRPPASRSTRSTSTRSTSYSKPKTGKVLERSRWFVPVPVVNLILDCVGR